MLHAPRSALRGDPAAAAGQRVADHHPARGLARSRGRARGVPRECVLGDARESQEGRRERHAGAAGREDAGLSACSIVDWQSARIYDRSGATRAGRARPSPGARGSRDAGARRPSSRPCAAKAMRRCAATPRELDGVELDELAVSAAEFAAARAHAAAPCRSRAIERAIDNVESFHRASQLRALAVETAAGRALRAADAPDRAGGTVRARRLRAAALDRGHARRAGAHRRLREPRAVHAAGPERRRQRRGAGRRASSAASTAYSRSAARRRSPPWPTGPRACPRSTRSSVPATPG